MSDIRKREFIHELAIYLVSNQAMQSIHLEMGKVSARVWQRVRSATPLMGYPTVKEAEKQLAEWLGVA